MKEIWTWVQAVFTALGAGLGGFLGGWDGFLYALVAFVLLDYLTGVAVAITQKRLSSEVGAKGILRKVLIFALVGVGSILDKHIIGTGTVFRTAVIFFYLSNEGISILENAAALGLPIPQKLRDILAQLKKDEEDTGNGD